MMKKTLLMTWMLLLGVVSAFADSQTITVKDQPTAKGETVAYADGSKTVAYTSANDAIWYLCDVDVAMLKSIEVKGLALVSGTVNEVETMAEMKIAYMPIGEETTVDADYLTANSSTIRGASRLLAKIVANTVPTTMAAGKNATNYPGADFLINAEVTKTGTYDGKVTMGECVGISKTSEKVHLFVYGTASSRRMAVDQIVVNTKAENPVYNKTTNTYYKDLNAAFDALTDADTELEVSEDVKITKRLNWTKAHTLTITPTADITLKGGPGYTSFLVSGSSAVLKIGSADHQITFDGESKAMTTESGLLQRESNGSLEVTNVAFKDFNLDSKAALFWAKNAGGTMTLNGVTVTNCTAPKGGYIYNLRVADNSLVLKGYVNIDKASTGVAIFQQANLKSAGTTEGRIQVSDDNFTASKVLSIDWVSSDASKDVFVEGRPVVVGVKASFAGRFELTSTEWVLDHQGNDLKIAKPGTATVQIGTKGYTDLYKAVAAANDGDVITLLSDQTMTKRLDVANYAVTIKGEGKSLKRGADYNAIVLLTATGKTPATLTLENVVLEGTATATNSFIEAGNNGSTVLNNVTIKDETTTANAVIICKTGGQLTLNGVTFSNCSAAKGDVFVGTNNVVLKGANTLSKIYLEKALVLKAEEATATTPIQLVTEKDKRTWGMLIEGGDATMFSNDDFRLSQQQDGVYAMPKAVAHEFAHPALLHTSADITAVKGRLSEGLTKAAFDYLKNAGAAASYTASPVTYLKRMDQTNWESTYSDFNNYLQAANDAKAAYQLALRYQLGGEENCATAAVKILNDWAKTNKGFLRLTRKADGTPYANSIPDPNEYLMTIQAYQFANAAELLRGYNGWQAADQETFKNWIRQTFADVAILFLENHHNNANAKHYWMNWDLAALNAMLSVGILCDDQALVDYALAYPAKTDDAAGTGTYANGIVATHTDAATGETLAQCQESGRDQGHATLDVTLLGVLCRTAQNSGANTDLFTNYKALEMAEYVGKYNLKNAAGEFVYTDNDVPFTEYNNGEVTHAAISAEARGTERPCWELFLAYAKQSNKAAAYVTEWVKYYRNKFAWGEGEPETTDELGFGTLMFSTPNDIPTGIETIENGQLTIDNYYDLQGRRVAQPTRGLYIANGKKIIFK